MDGMDWVVGSGAEVRQAAISLGPLRRYIAAAALPTNVTYYMSSTGCLQDVYGCSHVFEKFISSLSNIGN